MAINIPASFYKKAIQKFGELYEDPAALPALVLFVSRAEKSPANFKRAIADLKNDDAISKLIADVRDNLSTETIGLFQKYKDNIYEEMESKVHPESAIGRGEFLRIFGDVVKEIKGTHKKIDNTNAKLDKTQQKLEAAYQRIEEMKTALAEEKAARIAAEKEREADRIKNAKIARNARRREWVWGIATVIGTVFGVWGFFAAKPSEPAKSPEAGQERQKRDAAPKEQPTPQGETKEKPSEPALQPEKPAFDKSGQNEEPKAVRQKKEISLLFYNATQRLSVPKAAAVHVRNPICVRRPVEWSQLRRRSFSQSGPSGRG